MRGRPADAGRVLLRIALDVDEQQHRVVLLAELLDLLILHDADLVQRVAGVFTLHIVEIAVHRDSEARGLQLLPDDLAHGVRLVKAVLRRGRADDIDFQPGVRGRGDGQLVLVVLDQGDRLFRGQLGKSLMLRAADDGQPLLGGQQLRRCFGLVQTQARLEA